MKKPKNLQGKKKGISKLILLTFQILMIREHLMRLLTSETLITIDQSSKIQAQQEDYISQKV